MTITSRYSGKCKKCGATIPAGTKIEWEKGSNGISHAGYCPERVASPAPVVAPKSVPSTTTLTSSYPGKCRKCNEIVPAGTKIEWDKGARTLSHIGACPAPVRVATPATNKGQYMLHGGSGYGCSGWRIGQVVKNPESEGPPYLYVVSAKKEYIRDDGMSFGVGDDDGYLYDATCRAATEAEAAPLVARLAAAAAKKEAAKHLDELVRQIRNDGEIPVGSHSPEGVVIPIDGGQTIYGGGAWFVIGEGYVWYVRNNGADGDNWSNSNVVTGGAGAIGWRVLATPELSEEIRTAAAAAR